jgi:acyl carrier protein
MADIDEVVHAVLLRIIQQGTSPARKIQEGDRLTIELGLKSLDLARVISILELELGVDPFARLIAITDLRTVRDLCDAYRRALSPESATSPPVIGLGGRRGATTGPGADREKPGGLHTG